ncbi:Ger(x)C family spore germination protein [Peribacillus glennii]|uniref:Ger(X)C family spore germination protein n=1 Tax=Peribacillus glennii TaxID=2303991 RepID=A0A372L8C5_9BACI|nr:Ger(x)C family spore germination protein [Peribacillus glennii]RFU61137.1 Ger(x)C family spore germination protein [Peribacillus glennii]
MNRKWAFLFLMLACISLVSGCWSKKELTDVALVSALGIDIDEKGRYVGTFQIINPGNVAGGMQGGGAGQGPSVSVYSTTGNNIVEVSRRASTKISRRLYYAHTNLVVVSDELAEKEGLAAIMDAFDRHPEFRTTARVVIARESSAADIVKTLTAVDKIPANKVIKTMELTEKRWGEHVKTNIQEVTKDLVSPGKEPILTGFRMIGNAKKGEKMENVQESALDAILQADAIAVFKDDKLVDWLTGETARGTLWVLDKIKSTGISIDWQDKQEAIAYQVVRQKTKVTATMKNGQPQISINVQAEGDIDEANVPVNLADPRVLLRIEKALGKEIEKEIHKSIQHASQHKTDIFGFGEAMHRSEPESWKRMEKNWNDEHFPKLKVKVNVDAYIRRTGLRSKPMHFGGHLRVGPPVGQRVKAVGFSTPRG